MITNRTTAKTLKTAPVKSPRKSRPRLIAALLLLGFLLSGAGLAGTAFADLWFNKGVTYGANLAKIPHTKTADLGANPIGVNTFLHLETDRANITRSLDMLQAAGVGFIRQIFPWEDIEYQGKNQFLRKDGSDGWATFDFIVEQANARNIQVIARLDRPPIWSRLKVLDTLNAAQKQSVTGPPDDYAEFGRFVEVAVSRYKGKVKYYQLWNEPNLEAEWNAKKVDPAGYVSLLKFGYEAAKKADPKAVIIAAALAPTDQDSPEFNNLNELKYLNGMYQVGVKDYFDVMAVQIYGLGYSPDFRFTEPDFRQKNLKRVNFSSTADLHAIMEKWGDGNKPVWATEYGWVSVPADWPQSTQWGDSVSEQTQADYLIQGIERARREWPWMGVMNVWFFRADDMLDSRPDRTLEGNAKYFALVRRDYTPRPAFQALQKYLASDIKTAGTGFNPYVGKANNGDNIQFSFKGQRLDLELKVNKPATIAVRIDGKTLEEQKVSQGENKVKLADGLADELHQAQIGFKGDGAELAQLNGFYVSRSNQYGWLLIEGYVVFSMGLVVTGAGLAIRVFGWLEILLAWLVVGLKWTWRNREQIAPYAMIVVLLIYYFAPPLPLAVLGAVLFLPLAYLRPDWAIMLAVFTAPLYLEPRNLRASESPITILKSLIERRDPTIQPTTGVLEFSLSEVIIVLTAAAWILRVVSGQWSVVRSRQSAVGSRQDTDSPLPLGEGLGVRAVPDSSSTDAPTGVRVNPSPDTQSSVRHATIITPHPNPLPSKGRRNNNTSLSSILYPLFSILRSSPFILPLLVFFGAAVLSLLVVEPTHFREALREFRVIIVEPLVLFLLTIYFIKRGEQVQRIFDVLVLGGVLIAGVGLYQFLFTKENTVTAEGVSRVISIYNHPDNLGLYLGRIIPLAVAIAFFSTGWDRRRWLYLVALAPMVAALGLSFSRGAWLAVAAAVLVMVLVIGSKRGLIFYGLGALAGLASLPFIKVERITSLFTFGAGSSGTRLSLWQAGLEMIRDHPITGIGLDQFLYKYQIEYVPPEAWLERFTSHPHNFLLDYWLRLGIIGPVVIIWLLLVFFKLAGRLIRKPADKSAESQTRRILALGLLGSMADFVAHGLVDNSYFVIDLAIVFCVSCAMLEVLRREEGKG